jgi:hypothetical protein
MHARKDMHDSTKKVVALNSQTVSSSTTTVGNVIDTKGYHSLELIFTLGNWTDGTFTPLIEESDASDMSGSNAVADENLFGTEAAAALGADYAISSVGVWLGKRYVRASVVSSGVTSGSLGVCAVGVLAVDQSPAA